MIEFLLSNLGPLMFLGLFFFFLIGIPIAFALAGAGLLFAAIAIYFGILPPSILSSIPDNIWGRVMANDTLLAIPFFTLMGIILERSGMAENLLSTMGKLFGPVRGGLAYAVIVVGALLAATTGIVAASVMTMGMIALPVMQRYSYNHQIAAGTIAASGTLAQIIPPSLVLIVLADQLGRSVGDMYAWALLPSLLLTGVYALFIFCITLIFPHWVPAIPPEARQFQGGASYRRVLLGSLFPLGLLGWGALILFNPAVGLWPFIEGAGLLDAQSVAFMKSEIMAKKLAVVSPSDIPFQTAQILKQQGYALLGAIIDPFWGAVGSLGFLGALYALYGKALARFDTASAQGMKEVIAAIFPPLILIFLVLGTIFRGIATPTEGGAMGAAGAFFLALMNGRLSFSLLKQSLEKTALLSTFVMFILIGARIFSLIFYSLNGHLWVEHLFSALPGGTVGFLVAVNIMIFFLAFFLDFFELVFIVVPLLVPIANKLGIDLVWFGVALAMNIQTSFMHPPFGFSLFYLRSVAPMDEKKDAVTGRVIPPITTGQIYGGAIPYLLLQLGMVGIVLAFPNLVITNHQVDIDLTAIERQLPSLPQLPPPPSLLSLP